MRSLGFVDCRVRHHGRGGPDRAARPRPRTGDVCSGPRRLARGRAGGGLHVRRRRRRRHPVRGLHPAARARSPVADAGGGGIGATDPVDVAELDLGRGARRGYPEAIYCEGKTPEQVRAIAERLRDAAADGTTSGAVLFTRARHRARRRQCSSILPNAAARRDRPAPRLAAGSSGAERRTRRASSAPARPTCPSHARRVLTARFLGRETELVVDVGVAGPAPRPRPPRPHRPRPGHRRRRRHGRRPSERRRGAGCPRPSSPCPPPSATARPSGGSLPCWRCSTRARPGSASSTSTTATAPATSPRRSPPPDPTPIEGADPRVDPVRIRRRDRPRLRDAVLGGAGSSAWPTSRSAAPGASTSSTSIDDQLATVQETLDRHRPHGLQSSARRSGRSTSTTTSSRTSRGAARAPTWRKPLGAPYIRLFSFFIATSDDPDDHRDEVLRRMRALADVGEPATTWCSLHENEKDIYGDIPDRCLDIIESVGRRTFGLAWDAAELRAVRGSPVHRGVRLAAPAPGVHADQGRARGRRARSCRRRRRRPAASRPSGRCARTASTGSSRWSRTSATSTRSAASPVPSCSPTRTRPSPGCCTTKGSSTHEHRLQSGSRSSAPASSAPESSASSTARS